MINASIPTYRQSMRYIDAIDGFQVPVTLSGPETGRIVIMIDETPQKTDAYDIVRQRLHLAMFRTVVIPARATLSPKSVVDMLDQVNVTGGLLVGDGIGGELAWHLAATQRERFTGLVVIDVGHPRVPDNGGEVRDEHCPPIDVDTTALVSTRTAQSIAQASRRYVHGEFRLVEFAGRRRSRHFTAQLATEIVLRSFSR
jgi:pimeloyl-ACP methyl ester carboxylesterase